MTSAYNVHIYLNFKIKLKHLCKCFSSNTWLLLHATMTNKVYIYMNITYYKSTICLPALLGAIINVWGLKVIFRYFYSSESLQSKHFSFSVIFNRNCWWARYEKKVHQKRTIEGYVFSERKNSRFLLGTDHKIKTLTILKENSSNYKKSAFRVYILNRYRYL